MPIQTHPPTVQLALTSGERVRVRPLTPDDRDRLAEGFLQLSETARFQRFFTAMSHLSSRDLSYLTELDHIDHFAWGVESMDGSGVAVARYVAIAPHAAEAAFTIHDDFQGKGLGRRLFQALAAVAASRGFTAFDMTMLADNEPMARLATWAGARFEPPIDGTVSCEVPLEPHLWADLPGLDEFLCIADDAVRQHDQVPHPIDS